MARGRGMSLIDAYAWSLRPALIAGPRLRRRIVDEVRDHLLEATTRYRTEGLAPEEAERRAIAEFGSEQVVAGGFADAMREVRLMMRYSKAAGVFGCLFWLLGVMSPIFGELRWGGANVPNLHYLAPGILIGALLLSVGLFGAHARIKRTSPKASWVGWVLLSLGFLAGGPFIWGANLFGIAFVSIGGLLFGAAWLRARQPKMPALLLLVGIPLSFVIVPAVEWFGGPGGAIGGSFLAFVAWAGAGWMSMLTPAEDADDDVDMNHVAMSS